MKIIITTTWNSLDVIPTFLSHYRMLGFDRVLVMDYDSTDGSREVLIDPCWQGFVTLFPFPGLSGLDSSNMMLNHAKMEFPPETLALFCDPDELLVLPTMDARKDVPLDLGGHDVSGWIIRRNNMTCKRSDAIERQDEMHALGTLRYRTRGIYRNNPVALIDEDRIEPAFVFTRVGDKILVRLSEASAIGDGDHIAETSNILSAAPEGVYILHYPFRSMQAFDHKIAMAKQDFSTNMQLAPNYGWQLRRWIRLEAKGLLYREYLDQFPEDGDFDRHVTEGSLEEDTNVVDFHWHYANIAGKNHTIDEPWE